MDFYDDMVALKRMFPNVRLDVHYDEHEYLNGKKLMVLDVIEIPKDMRNHGLGIEIMKELVSLSRRYDCVFMLSPDDSLGATSKERLRRFYKRFGFVDNKGRCKKHQLPQYSMYLIA